MENHPIPQDVTGFQFKLVGSMTIKQFIYVAAGVLLAVIVYYLPLTVFIKFPLIFILVLLGLAIAFLPLEGRPMDLMAANFIKALLKPNQFFYKKDGGKLSFSELNLKPVQTETKKVSPEVNAQSGGVFNHNTQKEKQLESLLKTIDVEPHSSIDQKEGQYLSSLFTTINTPPVNTAIHSPVKQTVLPQHQSLSVQPKPTTQAIPTTHTTVPQINRIVPPSTITPTQKPVSMQQSVQAMPKTQPIQQAATTVQTPVTSPYVHVPPATARPTSVGTVRTGQTDFPNLITGTVKDPRGNVLSGILVEVKNKDGESVRAFKTNALGQFASATQLPNGVYTVGFDDPKGQNKFGTVQININGSVQTPLEIISIDAREELRKSLFG